MYTYIYIYIYIYMPFMKLPCPMPFVPFRGSFFVAKLLVVLEEKIVGPKIDLIFFVSW